MSRPPRPHFRTSTTGDQDGRRDQLDYLPMEFDLLLELQRRLAAESDVSAKDHEGDFLSSLMEASALLGHVLGLHQDLYAREAFLGTAQSAKSITRHARRLAHDPDSGVSATGLSVLTIGEGLEGTLSKGFSVASSPTGEHSAQDYETRRDLDVKSAWNALRPAEAALPAQVALDGSGAATLSVVGTSLGINIADLALLMTPSQQVALRVTAVREDRSHTRTDLTFAVDPSLGPLLLTVPPFDPEDPATNWRLLVRPRTVSHLFGWSSDPVQFPPSEINTAGQYSPPALVVGATASGFVVNPYSVHDVHLSAELPKEPAVPWAIAKLGDEYKPLRIASSAAKAVAFRRAQVVGIETPLFDEDGTPQIESNRIKTQQVPQRTETQISGSVTTWRLYDVNGVALARSSLPFSTTFHTDFELDLRLTDLRPNSAPLTQPLKVRGDLSGLRPGRRMVLSNATTGEYQAVTLQKLDHDGLGNARLYWGSSAAPLLAPLSSVVVHANVAEIVHGASKSQVLGGSDGVTPWQTFKLNEPGLSLLPDASGAAPALEVRVGDVRWHRVNDFHLSSPDDRHYIVEIDHEQNARVVFGDGIRGAIPPSGKKHIRANYSVGLGIGGNAAAGRVARIKKAHPLVKSAINRTAVTGGADPAGEQDIRRQSTRHLLTFDRAVSTADHAALALLFPGAARSSAQWSDRLGMTLVVADAEGKALSDQVALRSFLDGRRDATLPLTLLDPQAVDVYVTAAIEHDPDYLFENVKIAAQDALFGNASDAPGLFTFAGRALGEAAHLSHVYARLEAIPGVHHVRVDRLNLSPRVAAKDVLRVAGHQWLSLLPTNTDITSMVVSP